MGTRRIMGVPDPNHVGKAIPAVMDDLVLPQGRYPENFILIYSLEVCQKSGPSWGYLEDIEGS